MTCWLRVGESGKFEAPFLLVVVWQLSIYCSCRALAKFFLLFNLWNVSPGAQCAQATPPRSWLDHSCDKKQGEATPLLGQCGKVFQQLAHPSGIPNLHWLLGCKKWPREYTLNSICSLYYQDLWWLLLFGSGINLGVLFTSQTACGSIRPIALFMYLQKKTTSSFVLCLKEHRWECIGIDNALIIGRCSYAHFFLAPPPSHQR